MRIQLQTPGFPLTSAIEAHVRKELTQNLGTLDRQIISVKVFLGDINGPRGGEDKRAMVSVQLASRISIRLEAIHADLYLAVSLAARRLKHTLKRTLRRRGKIRKTELRELRQLQEPLHAC